MTIKLQQHISKIIPITDEEFTEISNFFTPLQFKKNDFLIEKEKWVFNDFFVLKGLLKACYLAPNGKEHILQFACEDWWITDYEAYFHQKISKLTIQCLENTEVLAISLENREKLCQKFQKMDTFFRKKTSFGYVALQKRILSLLNDDAKTRYKQFMSLYPNLLQRLPKTLIASYVGVSRETLSRLL